MIKINNVNIDLIECEYKHSIDFMHGDNCKAFKYLECLTDMEYRILITYCELMSYSEVGKLFNCSPSTVGNYIRRIKDKLLRAGLKKLDFYDDTDSF